jgi:hypothetical protein
VLWRRGTGAVCDVPVRVEWYIVILTVAEIVISLYELWAGHGSPGG